MKHCDGVECYQYPIEGLSPYVDVYIAETMSCVEEACQVVDALSIFYEKTDCVVKQPLFVSFTLNDDGKLRNNESIVDAIQKMVDFARDKNVECKFLQVTCYCRFILELNTSFPALSFQISNWNTRQLLRT